MSTSRTKKYKLDKVAIRMVKEPPLYSETPVTCTSDVVRVMSDAFKDMDREVMAVVSLRNDLAPINMSIVSMGTINACLAHPREIMKTPILSNASRMILLHNHPSGNLTPSREDVVITDHMARIGEMLEIPLLDHIILGHGDRYYSFRENGILPVPEVHYAQSVSDLNLPPVEGIVSEPAAKYDRAAAATRREEAMAAITDKLEKGVHAVFESDNYRQFLSCMSKFHNYSLNNMILIATQRPNATLVAGYQSWQRDHKRYVRKGEKGIRILAPSPYKVRLEQDKIDANTHQKVLDAQGNPVKETIEVERPSFRVATVFDVSQTEGEPLPQLGVDELTGSVDHYDQLRQALMDSARVPITFEQIEGSAKGWYSPSDDRIAIQEGMSELQTIKTMIHEITHSELHNREAQQRDEEENHPKDRSTKEVEAESVAYCVCAHYGIANENHANSESRDNSDKSDKSDSSEHGDIVGDYSFAYIAGWSSGKDVPELKASLQTIRDTACMLIERIDTRLEHLQQNRETEIPSLAVSIAGENPPAFATGKAENQSLPDKSGKQPSCLEALQQMRNKTLERQLIPKPMHKHIKELNLD